MNIIEHRIFFAITDEIKVQPPKNSLTNALLRCESLHCIYLILYPFLAANRLFTKKIWRFNINFSLLYDDLCVCVSYFNFIALIYRAYIQINADGFCLCSNETGTRYSLLANGVCVFHDIFYSLFFCVFGLNNSVEERKRCRSIPPTNLSSSSFMFLRRNKILYI